MTISKEITERLRKAGKRFYANDNISDYITEDEKTQLIEETSKNFETVLRSLIIDIDNDPNSMGTAKRLAKMYVNEIMAGRYNLDPVATAFPNGETVELFVSEAHQRQGITTKKFEKNYSGMLVVRSEIKSCCSHHWMPVDGVAYIGIIPDKEVIGLSKYTRIAQHLARRGTLQEELTKDILDAIKMATGSEDVGVHIAAEHGCCLNRGISAKSSLTQTTLLSGDFLKNPAMKKEFFDNIKMQQGNI